MKRKLISSCIMFLTSVICAAGDIPWQFDKWRQAPEIFPADPALFEFSVPEDVKPVFYAGADYQGRPTRVFAWLGIPDNPDGRKLPAMVLVHGGGGSAFAEWAAYWVRRGYAVIAMDLCSCIPTAGFEGYGIRKGHDFMPGPPDDIFGNNMPVADRWPYHAAASVMLAHSLLASLPEVDPEKIGLTGISWGGVVACIAAGIDDRFAFAAPVYGCGFIKEQTALYGNTPEAVVDEWCSLWDPVLYLPQVKIPMLFVSGATDHAFALDSWERSAALPEGKVTLSMRPELIHCHRYGIAPEVSAFADAVLQNRNVLPELQESKITGDVLHTSWNNAFEITGAELVYTSEGQKELQILEITTDCLQPVITVDIPVNAESGWLNIKTLDGCVFSTPRLYFRKN